MLEAVIGYVFKHFIVSMFYLLQINCRFSWYQRELTKSIYHKCMSKQFKIEFFLLTARSPKEGSDHFLYRYLLRDKIILISLFPTVILISII